MKKRSDENISYFFITANIITIRLLGTTLLIRAGLTLTVSPIKRELTQRRIEDEEGVDDQRASCGSSGYFLCADCKVSPC